MKRISPGKQLSSLGSDIEWPKEVNLLEQQRSYFPRSIGFEDIDKAVYDWFNTRDIEIENQKTPVFFLTHEKWGEFQKQWKYQDEDGQINMPYITIRRTGLAKGEPLRGRIPQPRRFTTVKVPVYAETGTTYRHYRVPQPIKVDMSYEIRVLTHYISDINKINEELIRHFASIQAYLDIDGHKMPMIIENIGDESQQDETGAERFLQTLFAVKCAAYIIDEEEFEVVDGASRMVLFINEFTT
jgi:hypothetical protein